MTRDLASLPGWPVALTEAEALEYTRVSVAQMKDWRTRGLVRFVPRGRNGAAIALRVDLDAAIDALFEGPGATSTDQWF
ncbi:hypothetical protein [Sphingomonas sp. CARO-RG-8B-R24-01]|uniref:hypothetical protein n=1 Tax=Sphingomonas sp. CARO-RG-8B-R24-01 TaxID=2914831 RepID=UPI001F55C0C0|nr:hypothetical protein [Sphingomonas sp. CARO-RG-8B-R24-01]